MSSLQHRFQAAGLQQLARALRPRIRTTLRLKGIIALVVLGLYEAGVALYVGHERARLLHIVRQLEHTNRQHELLIHVNGDLTHSIVGLQEFLNSDDPTAISDPVRLDLAALSRSLDGFKQSYPDLLGYLVRFEPLVAEFARQPTTEVRVALRDVQQELAARVARLEVETQQQARMLTLHYGDLNHRISVTILIANLLGLACFSVAVTLFFSKLASDIGRLEVHAMAMVGEDAPTLRELSRHDEVGGLMLAMNRMQAELKRREQLQEISRQQSFHQEKMAAIGSVAATLAHEIGNPINSISGIAQHTIDTIRSGQCPDSRTLLGNAELTVRQTERIGSIVRQLADLSTSHPPDPDLLNLNELVQTTCSFVRYDRRFRGTELVSDLDRNLPAVRAVNDHLTQVLMNLLINAADALEGASGRTPTIRVSTRKTRDGVTLSIHDNGRGMHPAVLTRAFQQSFTTKPPAQGRGIGLYVSKKLIEDIGGRIELESAVGVGTTARIRLPGVSIVVA